MDQKAGLEGRDREKGAFMALLRSRVGYAVIGPWSLLWTLEFVTRIVS
jgi:hypothetical protein